MAVRGEGDLEGLGFPLRLAAPLPVSSAEGSECTGLLLLEVCYVTHKHTSEQTELTPPSPQPTLSFVASGGGELEVVSFFSSADFFTIRTQNKNRTRTQNKNKNTE